jgi:hypothetical protein
MTDAKTTFRALLIGAPSITALVPATRIYQSWPTSFKDLPCISFREINNFTEGSDYSEDRPRTETSEMQVDIWCKPNTSATAIAQAIDSAVNAALWNRDYSGDFVEPDSAIIHRVVRYSTRLTA